MGPRSDERGNVSTVRAQQPRAIQTSMGPRSDERGNVEMGDETQCHYRHFNGGRAPMSAEIWQERCGRVHRDRRHFNGAALRMSAEMMCATDHRPDDPHFNGAALR